MTEQPQQVPQPTPEQLAAAAAQIAGQQSGLGPAGSGVPEEALGAQLAAGQAARGQALGATEVDVNQLLAVIQQMQDRVAALEAEKQAAHAPALLANAQSLAALLAGHPVTAITSTAADLLDAAANAIDSGDTTHVSNIVVKLEKLLRRNPPLYPQEPTSPYSQALDFASVHIPDAVDAFQPPAPKMTPLSLGTVRPAQVIAGNVTG